MALQLLTAQQQTFELGIVGFSAQTNCSISQTAAQAHDGTKALQLSSTAAGDMSAVTPNIAVQPGRTYTFSSWYRTAVSARTCNTLILWFQADGSTASLIRASDTVTCVDASGAWTQTTLGSVTSPSDAYFAQFEVQVKATAAGAEIHYVDTDTFADFGAPYFKHGSKAMLWFGARDISAFFNSAEWAVKVDTAEVSTFQSTWKAFIPGDMASTLVASGFYDPTMTNVQGTLASTASGVLTFLPAGGFAIGDQARLIADFTSDYKESSKVGGAVAFDWTNQATAPAEQGNLLHVLQSENVGTISGVGDPCGSGGVSTLTGAIAHLHVTAMTGGDTQNFKLQDSTSLNGAYTDITAGAFTAVTATGAQRLVIPGTIRAFVRAVAVIAGHAATYSIAVART